MVAVLMFLDAGEYLLFLLDWQGSIPHSFLISSCLGGFYGHWAQSTQDQQTLLSIPVSLVNWVFHLWVQSTQVQHALVSVPLSPKHIGQSGLSTIEPKVHKSVWVFHDWAQSTQVQHALLSATVWVFHHWVQSTQSVFPDQTGRWSTALSQNFLSSFFLYVIIFSTWTRVAVVVVVLG